MAEKYIYKCYDTKKENKRMKSFEAGKECGDLYNFHKQLKENNMRWDEYDLYGRITHQPTGQSICMSISKITTPRHKCYNLSKLKDKIEKKVQNKGTWIV